jgi:hypothetical protein
MTSSAVITSIVAERLCGSIPITTRSDPGVAMKLMQVLQMPDPLLVIEPGGQRCFECYKPFLSLSWP